MSLRYREVYTPSVLTAFRGLNIPTPRRFGVEIPVNSGKRKVSE
jgi:hypothetical protein